MATRLKDITFEQAFLAIIALACAIMGVIFGRVALEGAGMVEDTLLRPEVYGTYSAALALKMILLSHCLLLCASLFLVLVFRKAYSKLYQKLGS